MVWVLRMSIFRLMRATGLRGLGVALCALCLVACGGEDSSLVQGYIEGEFVYVACPFGGRLETLSVQRGQGVTKGEALFALDDTAERAARDQAQRRVDQAREEWEDAKLGQRPTEIQAIQAQLERAKAALVLAEIELERQNKLLASNVSARRDLDIAREARDGDRQHVTELEATLVTAGLGSRTGQVNAARQNLLAQEAALVGAEWNLAQKSQAAQELALVSDTLYRRGDWVPAGNPVVVLLPPGNVKVRVFVPEQLIGRVQIGSAAQVFVDGVTLPSAARVTFISPRAEFTPPVIYSQKMRAKFVFLVELSVDPATAAKLHPGQAVDVQLSL